MENKICRAGLIISVLALSACATQATFLSPLSPVEPASVLPTPAFTLTTTSAPPPTDTPTALPTATPPPTATPTAVPSPTPTFPPYHDKPFSVIFLRSGDLWLSEIGGSGEHRLTFENPPWQITSYAVSPDIMRIAYLSTQYDLPDARIMQVSLLDGSISALAGEGDLYLEEGVDWLDNNHLVYRIGEFRAVGHSKDEVWNLQPFNHMIVDVNTETYKPISDSLGFTASPNGRYWALYTCYYVYECPTPYKVRDLESGAEWQVVNDRDFAQGLAWSPDSRWLLVIADGWHAENSQATLYVVDLVTQERKTISPADRSVVSATWAPDSQSIIYSACNSTLDDCGVWLMKRDGSSSRSLWLGTRDVPVGFSWTPDSSRLVFTRNNAPDVVWSMKIDGTDLRTIVANADMPSALPERTEK